MIQALIIIVSVLATIGLLGAGVGIGVVVLAALILRVARKLALPDIASGLATIGLIGAGVGIGVVVLMSGVSLGVVPINSLTAFTISLIGASSIIIVLLIHLFVYTRIIGVKSILSKLKEIVGKVFSIRNIFTMLCFAITGWCIKTIITSYFCLDVYSLLGFISVVVPSGLISSVLKQFGEFILELGPLTETQTLKAGDSNVKYKYKYVCYSAQASGGGSGSAGGSGAGSGSAGGSGGGSGPTKKDIAIANYSVASVNELQAFANSPGDPGFLVPDPQGIGARGYIHGGINQPYAARLAAELKAQNVSGKTYHPQLDATAKRFLAAALPYIRPEVYGPQPSASTNASMVIQSTIKKLEKMA